MNQKTWLADRFETDRARLRAVAWRMLGSAQEAEDAVQEAWLRLERTDAAEIGNLGGWLTTVVARICLDMLRARRARREDALAPGVPEPTAGPGDHPEHQAMLADSIGLAMLVVLDTLAPAERVAFVLHDMFDLPFDDIAPILGRSPAATRQLASRARRRIRGAPAKPDGDRARQRAVVEAFLAAAHAGDLEALLAMLDPDAVFRADPVAVRMGGKPEIRGAAAIAETFRGRAQGARPALVDGTWALAVVPGGQLRLVLRLSFANGRIVAFEAVADPARLAGLDISIQPA